MYQTPNGAFVYTIVNLYNASQDISVSNVKYGGANLTDCRVNYASVDLNFAVPTAVWLMNITCKFDPHIELSATTTTVISMNNNYDDNPHMTIGASQASRLITLFRNDAYNDLLVGGFMGDLNAAYYLFYLLPNASIEWITGSVSFPKKIWRDQGRETFRGSISVNMTENYIYVWAGLVLSDLGVDSQQNVLNSVDAFNQHIKPLNWSWRLSELRESGTNKFLRGELPAEYDFQFGVKEPTTFNAYYLCEYTSWKSGISLFVDVFVATASLFMAFWGILNLVLRFWATGSSEKTVQIVKMRWIKRVIQSPPPTIYRKKDYTAECQ
ncbi:hypothetical protein RhiJN_18328 [Ceratobasidium sp. AG-Ba]|nr:hypothetical protein RhiJN_18328 [Ceratobasidium sp. AG-Ba]